ncbi:MAG: hypothetical protein ACE5D6_06730 [Candidatus Zixiibacteriota bacterium]
MPTIKMLLLTSFLLVLFISSASTATVSLKVSGPGAINDSTIKVGEKVSIDVYFVNKSNYKGFSLGFKFTSPDIKNVTHIADSGKGLNNNGDIKGYNGWNDKSIWDFGGVYTVEKNWDGKLPELIGFGGLSIKKGYSPHELAKNLSIEMQFNETGSVIVDSTFFPPSGKWMFAPPTYIPQWEGPYTFKVVK